MDMIAPQVSAEDFYGGALFRIRGFMLGVAAVSVPACWVRYGAPVGLGMAGGCAIAWLNFYWLKRVVTGFADRVSAQGAAQPSSGLVLRFFLRHLLMAMGAYVIFRFSPASVYGLFAGLFLPVAGIVCEAVYEAYAGLRRGL
jgi:ATP synthase I chain